MPIATVSLLEGASTERKRAVIARVTQALAESLDVPSSSVRVLLSEIPSAHWGVGGKALDDPQPSSTI